jgi:Uma2 family endonuclease
MTAALPARIPPEEYFELERTAEIKSEYYDGQMFAMSGGTLAHSLLEGQLVSELRIRLRGKGCRQATSNLRVAITPRGPFVYPDASVYCGAPQLLEKFRDTLLHPTVVFEILSKSTEAYDRGAKSAQYRRVESLQEYVLISQTEMRVEVVSRRPEGKWTLAEYVGAEAVAPLASIGIELPLADLYEDIQLESEEANKMSVSETDV